MLQKQTAVDTVRVFAGPGLFFGFLNNILYWRKGFWQGCRMGCYLQGLCMWGVLVDTVRGFWMVAFAIEWGGLKGCSGFLLVLAYLRGSE